MAGAMRQICRATNAQMRGVAQHQQRRMAGNLPVKPNKFVEEWATRREHLESEFRWDGKTLTRIAVFAFAVPYAIYNITILEFNKVDERAGRPLREMWGNEEA